MQYFSTSEILEKFDLENGGDYAVCFSLWNPLDGTKNIIKKVDLNPEKCNGHTFRYCTQGWGVQQLYLGGIQEEYLNSSRFLGFNEKGALAKDSYYCFTDSVAHKLDWKLIRSDQRKLKNYIEKKIGSINKNNKGVILHHANEEINDNKLKIR